ncbi:thiolase family protein [Prescottella equi]|uniref:thiolase family protein n=1 Tax=Rhodococcus hoagii TaxID=43767 RepID=UPI000A0FDB6B|nr:thiolase family protein [Prescottella equi]ORL16036.1 acetyl-CoA acetyltransferase [Prescottella equi]
MTNAVIIDAVRLASGKGKPGGALSGTHPVELLAQVLRALIDRNDLDPALVDDVIGGCVQQVGEQALNISRTALLSAGFPDSVPATTIDRQCGSSQQAAHFAAQGVIAGAYDIVIACGVESMSRIPMGTSPMGQDPAGPGIATRYPEGLIHQGISAELIAAKWKLDRDTLDAYSAESHRRAAAATASGFFDAEIVPIAVRSSDNGAIVPHSVDETVRAATTADSLAGLRTSFHTDELSARFPEAQWHITPGNSSPLTDGASAVLIMSEEMANKLDLTPRARFHSFSVAGDDPMFMLTAPVPATHKVLAKAGLSIDDIDAYEVNEAFAPVPLMWAHEFGADPAKLNPRGGAIALGHALGSSGTRLLTTLVNHLEATGGRYGLQTMCEGAGMANATIIERL